MKVMLLHYWDHVRSILTALADLFTIKISLASLLGIYSFFFGPDLRMVMLSLITLMVFDLITGTSVAWRKHSISSSRAVKTPIKFAIYCLLVSAAHMTDSSVFGGLYLEQAMVAFLALTELISIIENAGKLGFAVPHSMLKRLENLRDAELDSADKKERAATNILINRADRKARNLKNDRDARLDRNLRHEVADRKTRSRKNKA